MRRRASAAIQNNEQAGPLNGICGIRTDRIVKNHCNWLLTPIVAGIVLRSFRLQGHELFREGSRFFAGSRRRRATNKLLAAGVCRDTLPEIFPEATGLRREARLALGLFGAPPG